MQSSLVWSSFTKSKISTASKNYDQTYQQTEIKNIKELCVWEIALGSPVVPLLKYMMARPFGSTCTGRNSSSQSCCFNKSENTVYFSDLPKTIISGLKFAPSKLSSIKLIAASSTKIILGSTKRNKCVVCLADDDDSRFDIVAPKNADAIMEIALSRVLEEQKVTMSLEVIPFFCKAIATRVLLNLTLE